MSNNDAGEPIIGILTVSDRASRGEYEDRGGPAIAAWLATRLAPPYALERRVVPDEIDAIESALREFCDTTRASLVISTGGTGPAPRDVTPEAVAKVADRILPGFGERMRSASITQVPTALLSRQLGATRGATLILALPGQPRAIAECLEAVFAAVPHCIEQLGGARLKLQNAATPASGIPKH
ncbi:MAG: molybdopterin adenylyltransferase [Planctomycetota bacterium]